MRGALFRRNLQQELLLRLPLKEPPPMGALRNPSLRMRIRRKEGFGVLLLVA